MSLSLRPVTLMEARRFVAENHRHNEPPVTWRFGVGVENGAGELVGVALAGMPKARMSCDGFTLEVNRTCTDGTRNANSMLYGAILRAAKALGYRRVYTYTLPDESGASLRAVGFVLDKTLEARRGWEAERGKGAHQNDLFGARKMPTGPKQRWIWEAVS